MSVAISLSKIVRFRDHSWKQGTTFKLKLFSVLLSIEILVLVRRLFIDTTMLIENKTPASLFMQNWIHLFQRVPNVDHLDLLITIFVAFVCSDDFQCNLKGECELDNGQCKCNQDWTASPDCSGTLSYLICTFDVIRWHSRFEFWVRKNRWKDK